MFTNHIIYVNFKFQLKFDRFYLKIIQTFETEQGENKKIKKIGRYESSKVRIHVYIMYGCLTCFLLEIQIPYPIYYSSVSLWSHIPKGVFSLCLFRPNNNDMLLLAHKAARTQSCNLFANSASFSTVRSLFSPF